MSEAVLLTDRGVIEISGVDAISFLHNLVTNDITSLAAGEARFAALLTPQGKIISDFLVFREDADGGARLLLDCPRALIPELLPKLNRYRLRAKAVVVDKSDLYVNLAFLGDEKPEADVIALARDPRSTVMGWRAIALDGAAAAGGQRADYEARRISAGVPDGLIDFAYGDAYPHEANMDRLSGLDFKKGCYVGQEIVSRMQHRTTVKKRVTPFRMQSDAAPAPGTNVLAGETNIGVTGSHSGSEGLALVRLDRLEEALAAGHTAQAAGVPLDFPSAGVDPT
jgi:tRNA-modifying protein YgfZ